MVIESDDGFPTLGTGGVVKAFPSLKTGDVLKVVADLVPDAAPGQGIVLHRIDAEQVVLLHESGDEDDPSDVVAVIAAVETTSVTLEVTRATDAEDS